MSDLVLRTASRARDMQYQLVFSLTAFAHDRIERLHREERGQDMIEYAGVLVVVALIVTAIIAFAPTISGSLKTHITTILNKIFSGF